MYIAPHVLNNKGYRMHNSDAMSILNSAYDSPCCFTHGVWNYVYFEARVKFVAQ